MVARKPKVGGVVALRLDDKGDVWGTADVVAITDDFLVLDLRLDEEWASRRGVPFVPPMVLERVEVSISDAGVLWN